MPLAVAICDPPVFNHEAEQTRLAKDADPPLVHASRYLRLPRLCQRAMERMIID